MTTTAPRTARHAHTGPHRPRVMWLIWRQHRMALLGAIGVLAAIGTVLLINGLQLHADWRALPRACRTPAELLGNSDGPNDPCGPRPTSFVGRYTEMRRLLPDVLLLLPALVGAFVGAPLVGRELESGTFKFAWTQGIDRTRWLLGKLLVLGLSLGIAALGLSALHSWWFAPLQPAFGHIRALESYEVDGIVFAARTVFAFALGALLGAIIRRAVPAIFATVAVSVAVIFASASLIRPHIQAPIVVALGSPQGTANQDTEWRLGSWVQDRAGHHITDGQINAAFASLPQQQPNDAPLPDVFTVHGWTQMVKYQPNSRFWHFQIVESLGYLALAVVLGGASVWWVRRRAT